MDFGRPLIYRLASLIVSELGRAYDTWQQEATIFWIKTRLTFVYKTKETKLSKSTNIEIYQTVDILIIFWI